MSPPKDRGQVGLCRATRTMGMLTLAQEASCSSKAMGPHGTRTFSLPTRDGCPLHAGSSPTPCPSPVSLLVPAQHCPYSD